MWLFQDVSLVSHLICEVDLYFYLSFFYQTYLWLLFEQK